MSRAQRDLRKSGNSRREVTSSAEHDSRVRQPEPLVVVHLHLLHHLSYELVVSATYYEADREARGVRGRRDEAEAS